MSPNDLIDMHCCKVRGDDGVELATLYEDDGELVVVREPACTIGDYMYILGYLRELGFDVR